MQRPYFVTTLALAALTATMCPGQDWTNIGGNAQRNGLMPGVVGPRMASLFWQNTDDFSIITWQPFVHAGRAFVIREAGFPGPAANDALIAHDLQTGAEDWRLTVPYAGNPDLEWIAWIAGARDGRVYATRAAHEKPNPIHAFDATDGTLLWTSDWLTESFAYNGVVFAADGDLIVGDFTTIARIDAVDGSTVWDTDRSCSVSGNCGGAAAVGLNAVYIDESAAGGQIITKIDLATGEKLYSSPIMPGFLSQTSPFLSPDEMTVYYARTQNNTDVDFLYAFEDTGTEFVERWSFAIGYGETPGIGPDGTVYARVANRDQLVGLDPDTGQIVHFGADLEPLGNTRYIATDARGTVYVSNGWSSSPATDGRLWVFSPDLADTYFTLDLDRQNQGGPVLAGDNLLIVADRNGVYAYAGPQIGDMNCDGAISPADIDPFVIALTGGPDAYQALFPNCAYILADINNDNAVSAADIDGFVLLLTGG
jgi:outer membrane protein assembly factor BamB